MNNINLNLHGGGHRIFTSSSTPQYENNPKYFIFKPATVAEVGYSSDTYRWGYYYMQDEYSNSLGGTQYKTSEETYPHQGRYGTFLSNPYNGIVTPDYFHIQSRQSETTASFQFFWDTSDEVTSSLTNYWISHFGIIIGNVGEASPSEVILLDDIVFDFNYFSKIIQSFTVNGDVQAEIHDYLQQSMTNNDGNLVFNITMNFEY